MFRYHAGRNTENQNFIKAFGNRLDWGFVTNTNDGDSHRVWVTFNEAKEYTITVDARSSYLFIDKMVLHRSNVSGSVAFDLSNSESSCYDASLSVDSESLKEIKVFPNPTNGRVELRNLPINSNLVLSNIYGAIIREIKIEKSTQIIDISELGSGIYFITNRGGKKLFSKKIIKL